MAHQQHRLLNRIKTYLKGALPHSLSEELRLKISESVKSYNLKTFSIITFSGGVLFLFLVVIDYVNYTNGAWDTFPSYYNAFLIHAISSPVFLLVGLVSYFLNFSKGKVAPRFYGWLIFLNLIVTSTTIFALHYWELYEFSSNGTFIIYVFILVVVQQFPLKLDLILYSFLATVHFGIPIWMGIGVEEAPALYVNGIGTFALAFVLSRIVYAQKIESLSNRFLLEEKNNELIKSNENLSLFTRTASHDLREPLRTIVTYLSLIKRKSNTQLSQQVLQYLNFSIDSAQRLNHLIDDLLDLSTLDQGNRKNQSVDLKQLVEDIKLHLHDQILEKGAQVSSDSLPVLKGDYSQFLQLFQNLISNGIKYNESGSPTVHLMAYPVGKRFIIIVRDNGIGIQKQYHETIFEAFNRLYPNDKYEGSGIGLTICKKIVEYYGGDIKVRSTEDRETEFLINFPSSLLLEMDTYEVE